MQRDLVVILYDSIYNQYKIVKMQNYKYHKLLLLGTISSSFIYRCRWVYLQFYIFTILYWL
jgi:hypothetical protein